MVGGYDDEDDEKGLGDEREKDVKLDLQKMKEKYEKGKVRIKV